MMRVEISAFDRDLLLANPETKTLAEILLVEKVALAGTGEQFNEMRDACSDLLQRIGFDEKYSPTNEGQTLESLIDKLFK